MMTDRPRNQGTAGEPRDGNSGKSSALDSGSNPLGNRTLVSVPCGTEISSDCRGNCGIAGEHGFLSAAEGNNRDGGLEPIQHLIGPPQTHFDVAERFPRVLRNSAAGQ